MFYVYRIQIIKYPDRSYTGFTEDLKQRVSDHNQGRNVSTAPIEPGSWFSTQRSKRRKLPWISNAISSLDLAKRLRESVFGNLIRRELSGCGPEHGELNSAGWTRSVILAL